MSPLGEASQRNTPMEGPWMHLIPREIEKVLVYALAEVALKRKAKGL